MLAYACLNFIFDDDKSYFNSIVNSILFRGKASLADLNGDPVGSAVIYRFGLWSQPLSSICPGSSSQLSAPLFPYLHHSRHRRLWQGLASLKNRKFLKKLDLTCLFQFDESLFLDEIPSILAMNVFPAFIRTVQNKERLTN